MSKFLFILEYNEYIESLINSKYSKFTDEYIYNCMLDNYKDKIIPIKEGLIYSQPVDTTIRVLKNKFSELEIKKYDDGDIVLSGMNDKLKKYIPLINNLGYFISNAFDDNDDAIDINKNNIEELNCYYIFIEPKYDYQVEVPNILYHVSPLKFKDKILKSGLTPKSGNKLSSHPDRIYLSSSINTCIMFGKYLLQSAGSSEYYKNGYCIYIIKGNGVDKLYSDINLRVGGFYTLNNISKEFITLFKEVII
jgi:hypothetical protein